MTWRSQDETGRRLARLRLPEGIEGITRLHALLAEHLPEEWADPRPARPGPRSWSGSRPTGAPWVSALVAAGYQVYAINPMSVARYRERHSTSGAKSDAGDAHVLAEIVRLDRAHHRRSPATRADARRLEARRPQPPDADLGPAPARAAAAGHVAGVLPGRTGRVRAPLT